ncbi:MAG: 6-bladed beta-propeller [Nitrospiraceae bacterium]|nr:MAG: 6-bladed beta-propeller [Nitrospiraceae bacterium]
MCNEHASIKGAYSGYPALNICLCLLLLVLAGLLVPANNAYGLRLTHVKHLFDLTQSFKQPSDVAVSHEGQIYVVDGVNNKIKVFNQNGKFSFSFGQKGSGNGEFNFPLGICVDRTGRVYVADSGNSRVQAFTTAGNYLGQLKLQSKNGTAPDPTDVAVDHNGRTLYAIDNNNHNVHAYNLSNGRLTGIYGSPGEGNREFRYPFFISLDSEDYLYIVDVINTRVQVLNPEGLYVASIGKWGVEKGSFFRPKGVALDAKDRIYVSDSYMGVIQVFDPEGVFYSTIGDPVTNSVRKFTTPTGIYIDDNNRLYVVEMFAEKVSVYQIEKDTE